MNSKLNDDLEQIDSILERIKQQGIWYLQDLDTRLTSTEASVELATKLSENGMGTLRALKQFNQRFEKLIVASSGPRYWGFVTGGTTPAAIAGDWLTTIYDQNTQSIKGQGDISATIEVETIKLLLDLFGLPDTFLGGFVTGATMSNFSCLGVARQWIGKQSGNDFAKDGISRKIHVLTATPHSSVIKSLSMLGMGSNNPTMIKTLEGNREAMDITDLERVIDQLDGDPFILISSGGTVNTVDFDDFTAISKLKKKYKFWWHIDAAFGAFAACSDNYKHLVEGWEFADSITIDCHKWLNVPYESAVFLVKQDHQVIQTETYQNTNAPYINLKADFNYLNFLPENSRRLKALPAWFTLMAYGKEGYRDIVENSVKIAKDLGRSIEESEYWELLAPVRLNTVCFTLKGDNEEKVQPFLSRLNNSGKVFMTPTVYKGRTGIRAAFVNWRTSQKDLEMVLDQMQNSFSKL
ncbi:MAG TPA: pyridoxal-dependent decarboxylase [Flavobacterium sp.]|jgi:glutamate/tyrosine decarboxylase-like PLP-dependent enzyme